MLYANEVINLYDPETGLVDVKEDNKKIDAELELFIEEGKALQSLKEQPGWKIVEKFLIESAKYYQDKLVLSNDYDQIRRLQEAVKTYSNVLDYVNQRITEAQNFDMQRTLNQSGQSIGGK